MKHSTIAEVLGEPHRLIEKQGTPSSSSSALLTREDAEALIKRVVETCNGHRQRAAAILGISERNLYRKLKEIEALAEK